MPKEVRPRGSERAVGVALGGSDADEENMASAWWMSTCGWASGEDVLKMFRSVLPMTHGVYRGGEKVSSLRWSTACSASGRRLQVPSVKNWQIRREMHYPARRRIRTSSSPSSSTPTAASPDVHHGVSPLDVLQGRIHGGTTWRPSPRRLSAVLGRSCCWPC